MRPDLELVDIGCQDSFKAWEHGSPFRTVRWHFHPEHEPHHVVATSGLRINLASQLLMSPKRPAVTEVVFASGFNNLSNFNRQFLAQKGMPPSRFRAPMLSQGPPAAA